MASATDIAKRYFQALGDVAGQLRQAAAATVA
jgi:hypothetical protein